MKIQITSLDDDGVAFCTHSNDDLNTLEDVLIEYMMLDVKSDEGLTSEEISGIEDMYRENYQTNGVVGVVLTEYGSEVCHEI